MIAEHYIQKLIIIGMLWALNFFSILEDIKEHFFHTSVDKNI